MIDPRDLNFYKIIIASYLHDIWKILWRGWFDRIIFNNEKDYKVSHAQIMRDFLLYPKDFFEKNKKTWFSYNLELEDFKNNDFWKDIVYIWSLHHKNDMNNKYNNVFDYIKNKDEIDFRKRLVSIVYLSDNIASLDRFQEENNKDEKELDNKNIKSIWLWSIFENIFNFDKLEKNNYSFEPNILNNIIWSKIDQKVNFSEISIKFLKEVIIFLEKNKEIYKKEEKDLKRFVYDLDLIFQNYTTLIPSDAFQWKTQDLSLYDHTKIVVAISSILYKQLLNNDLVKYSPVRNKEQFIDKFDTNNIQEKEISLIAWDFPSIQKYIFDGIKKQKGISKRLRSKSFIVQMLSESIIEYVLEKIWYTRSNVLINAWWKFVIIWDKMSKEKIEKLKEDINTFLFKKYNWNIKFSLISKNYQIWEVFANNLIKDKNWKDKNFSLEKVKMTFVDLFEDLSKDKFKIYNKNNLKEIFTKKEEKWILCKYCWQNYLEKKEEFDENSDENMCQICENEKCIWENLVKKDSIFIKYIDKKWYFDFNLDFDKWKFDRWYLKVLFNNWDYSKLEKNVWIWKSINIYVPKDNNWDTKDFKTIIDDDKKEWNVNWWLDYICMLKWDIDAMSLIFKHWFDFWERLKQDIYNENWNTLYSINRLTQFSRFLELFFWTYLNKKIEEKFKNIYTVFSWWDDFIFIVPFLQRQKFVKFIYEEFNSFIWNNEKIHFSIWLWIFKDKTPFKTMDDLTEKLLKKAKKNSKEKNILENNNWKIIWVIKEDEWLLKHRWITIYEEDFTTIFINEEVNYINWVKNWDKENIWYKDDDYYKKEWREIENELEFIIWDTQIYSIYSELTKFRDIYKQNNIDYSETILIWARILNMLSRNNKESKENIWFKNLKKDIENLIWKISLIEKDKDEKIKIVNNILVWLVDNMYKNRYKNTK